MIARKMTILSWKMKVMMKADEEDQESVESEENGIVNNSQVDRQQINRYH